MTHTHNVQLCALQVARLYGIGITTLSTLRRIYPDFPAPTGLIGRRHAWDAAAIVAWFDASPTKYRQQFDPFNADELAANAPTPTAGKAHA